MGHILVGFLATIDGATDMTEEIKQTEPPWAPGLDEWHVHAASSADSADVEKRAIEAEDFQAERTARYLASGGTDDIGGFEYGFGEATNKGDF
jgi:hypothetical protein